ncbi:MAG: FG-GAP-like repeat-containing protein, partial [Flavobacteriales bacterium]|nr:FG-GAP-like repeat-containing protein [Flavobacteriales bacterium]
MKAISHIILIASTFFISFIGYAQSGVVLSHQKISPTQGNFNEPLNHLDVFGSGITNIGDLDNDGINDLAIGVTGDDDGSSNAGAVWILFLNSNGSVKSKQKISSTQGNFTGTISGDDRFGSGIAALGDLDNDGVEDIAVGARLDDDGGSDRGAVWILFLNSNGTVKSHSKISNNSINLSGLLTDNNEFGHDVANIGDIDNDGVTDIVVSNVKDDDGGFNTGAVWTLLLNSNGTVKAAQKISNTSGGMSGQLNAMDFFGDAVAPIGDLNNDGVEDIAVGAGADDDGGSSHGAVWILFLNSNGTVSSSQKISSTQGNFSGFLSQNDWFGSSIDEVGDVDGDGVNDLAVGAVFDDEGGTDNGAIYLLFMNTNGTVKAHQKIADNSGNFNGTLTLSGAFGTDVAGLGDINGDGKNDIAVGNGWDDDGGSFRGAVWILFLDGQSTGGGSGSTTNVIDTICQGETYVVGTSTYSNTGTYVDTLTDISGNDSIVNLDLTVNPTFNTFLPIQLCSGGSVTIAGVTYTQPGNYFDTLTSVTNGCDSVLTIQITSIRPIQYNIYETICQGDSVVIDGTAYYNPGSFKDTLVGANGCDSFIVLNLAVIPNYNVTINQQICQGDTFFFNGNAYANSGTYVDTVTTVQGCDSIVTINLSAVNEIVDSLALSICEGDSIIVGNSTYKNTGIYIDTLTSQAGCDSIVVLDLVVNATVYDTLNQTICVGDSLVINGNVYTQPGTYVDTLLSSVDCDSVLTINLQVDTAITTTLIHTICEGDSVVVGNQVYYLPGSYSDTLASSAGCDSIVNLHLFVNPSFYTLILDTICQGDSVAFGNAYYSNTGTYIDSFTTANGCDSILELQLMVNPSYDIVLNDSICDGQFVEIGGNTYDSTGIYFDTLQTLAGCDSIIELHLTVVQEFFSSQTIQLCDGDSFLFGGNVYTVNDTLYDSLLTSNGCDSIEQYILAFNPSYDLNLIDTICQGDSIIIGNNVYDSTGVYSDTLQTANGCDSIVNLNLTVVPIYYVLTVDTICQGDTYSWNGNVYTNTGVYQDTLSSIAGCDSLIGLHLTVTPTIVNIIYDTICYGDTSFFNGNVYDSSGIYLDTLTSLSTGCDSVVHYQLYERLPIVTTSNVTLCFGDSILFNGQYYSEWGSYTETNTSASGCDSLHILNLLVLDPIVGVTNTTICEGDSVLFNGVYYSEWGSYVDTSLTAANGCDSLHILN